ncbi:MAG TPA: hypothetical protein VEV87_09740 [Chitinophagaceae bacterium]|nr:hypothetical protein [Chitinophagaceae bacterium]
MNEAVQNRYIYVKMSIRALKRSPSVKTLSYLFRYFSPWRKYLVKERNSVIDKQPWLTFPAIDFIKGVLNPGMRVFEFGSGGSTLFWAYRTKEVISVEHDEKWYLLMKQTLKEQKIGNVSYFFIPPQNEANSIGKDPGNPGDYISSDEQYKNESFKEYATSIDRYQPEFFDIILVDGRARPSCIAHALGKLKKNGYLVIDNSERNYYLEPFTFEAPGWKVYRFYGPVPYTHSFSETTIIEKR